ncbi:AraC family transcriptional regulator [Saccharibacillus sp. CPCC 101409]|uniref:AraC family transcriptional regulator n=1 Tax=Saccharibacillus sp. CPCC 101409 TaxID=3058041 RepID=UPI0026734E2A|nr:AraC family transcriptional regulator [Saccharibacillus sp. CPCC 101409]MDO3413077.1 AraC family transcriptional regulator [Saccharibacillus sp. CPCC 101409]
MALEVFSDLSERLNYNLPNFPLYVRKGWLHQFDRYAAAYHWHPDVEFILVLDGAMDYFIHGQTVHMKQGDGIFVNSKRLHYGFSSTETDCCFIVVAVHPVLLGAETLAGKAYLEEKFGPSAADFLTLSDSVPWQRDVLSSLDALYREMHGGTDNLLLLLSQTASLCASVSAHLHREQQSGGDEHAWMLIRRMTHRIHQCYESKLTVDEIAASGPVCRSRCSELFKQHIGESPNNYLIRYRIQKSCEMLKETARPVSEIALACGFQTSSYFSSVFRKQIGLSPQDFRKQSGGSSA